MFVSIELQISMHFSCYRVCYPGYYISEMISGYPCRIRNPRCYFYEVVLDSLSKLLCKKLMISFSLIALVEVSKNFFKTS